MSYSRANQIFKPVPLIISAITMLWNHNSADSLKGKNANTQIQAVLSKKKSPNAWTPLIHENQIPTHPTLVRT
jgi:hypothetical protein